MPRAGTLSPKATGQCHRRPFDSGHPCIILARTRPLTRRNRPAGGIVMNATLRRFLFCSLVLAPCLVATPGGAVLIKTQDAVVAPTEKPIEISGRLTLELRDALNTVMAGRYDDAIAQSDRLIGN